MAYRGSLRQCITAAAFNFQTNGYEYLAILCNKPGKYYTLTHDPDQFLSPGNPERRSHRLVFYGTFKELRAFTNSTQLKLFQGENDANTQENTQSR